MKPIFLKLKTLPLLLIALLNEMGYGLIIPLLAPQIIYSPQGILSSISSASNRHLLYGCITATYSICSMLSAPIWGKLSDFYGRKLILLIALFGSLIGFSLYIASFLLGQISLFIAARVITGATAGSIAVALAGVLDFSDKPDKLKQLSYFFVTLTVALVAGPLLGGLFAVNANKAVSIQPFLAAITLLLLAIIIIKFCFKEAKVVVATSKQTVSSIFSSLNKTRLINICIMLICLELAWSLYFSSITLFLVKAYQFHGSQIALFITALGLSMCLGLTLVYSSLAKIVTTRQQIILGFFSAAIAFCLAGFATPIILHWIIGMLIAAAVGFSFIAIISAYLQHVESEHQGLMMGLLVNLISLAWIISTLLSGIFSYYSLSLPFYISAGFLSIGLVGLLLKKLPI